MNSDIYWLYHRYFPVNVAFNSYHVTTIMLQLSNQKSGKEYFANFMDLKNRFSRFGLLLQCYQAGNFQLVISHKSRILQFRLHINIYQLLLNYFNNCFSYPAIQSMCPLCRESFLNFRFLFSSWPTKLMVWRHLTQRFGPHWSNFRKVGNSIFKQPTYVYL